MVCRIFSTTYSGSARQQSIVSMGRSIEATAKADNHVPRLSFNWLNTVDTLVVAVEKAAHQLW
jgi:hypothetical protein